MQDIIHGSPVQGGLSSYLLVILGQLLKVPLMKWYVTSTENKTCIPRGTGVSRPEFTWNWGSFDFRSGTVTVYDWINAQISERMGGGSYRLMMYDVMQFPPRWPILSFKIHYSVDWSQKTTTVQGRISSANFRKLLEWTGDLLQTTVVGRSQLLNAESPKDSNSQALNESVWNFNLMDSYSCCIDAPMRHDI